MTPPTADLLDASSYEEDAFVWTQQQARPPRGRGFQEIDLDQLVDEVESVGRSERDTIERRMGVLLAHLLKWKFQPGARSRDCIAKILEQRRGRKRVLLNVPSLNGYPSEVFENCYLGSPSGIPRNRHRFHALSDDVAFYRGAGSRRGFCAQAARSLRPVVRTMP